MPYTQTNWVDGATPLNRTNMMKIEDELALLDANVSKVPGTELAYVTYGNFASISATSFAGGTVLATLPSLSLDGATKIAIEFYSSFLVAPQGANIDIWVQLGDNGAGLDALGRLRTQAAGANAGAVGYSVVYLTPSAGAHVYTAVAFMSSGTGAVSPGYLRACRA